MIQMLNGNIRLVLKLIICFSKRHPLIAFVQILPYLALSTRKKRCIFQWHSNCYVIGWMTRFCVVSTGIPWYVVNAVSVWLNTHTLRRSENSQMKSPTRTSVSEVQPDRISTITWPASAFLIGSHGTMASVLDSHSGFEIDGEIRGAKWIKC